MNTLRTLLLALGLALPLTAQNDPAPEPTAPPATTVSKVEIGRAHV